MRGANANLRLGASLHKLLPSCGGGYRWGVNQATPPHPILPPPGGKGLLDLQISMTMLASVGRLVAAGLLLVQGLAWAAEPVAVLTEIRIGTGEVQVKFADAADWIAPQLLLALQPGDQLRATGDGQAVIMFIWPPARSRSSAYPSSRRRPAGRDDASSGTRPRRGSL
jgi:hypothetical protein